MTERRRVLVVGASRGIGAATARAFAAHGDELVIAARSADALSVLANELGSERVSIATIDQRDPVSVADGVNDAAARLGGIDVVVGAGGISPVLKRIEDVQVSEWDEIQATNSRGGFLLARAAARHLRASHGSLIFVTSIHESAGAARLSAYAASKGALRQLARSLALEWAADGVRVNCVAPAYVETDLTAGIRSRPHLIEPIIARTPIGRLATADEIAGAIVFLASPDASYITGTTLFVDGGWTAG